jgi:hypothetical protein
MARSHAVSGVVITNASTYLLVRKKNGAVARGFGRRRRHERESLPCGRDDDDEEDSVGSAIARSRASETQ